MEQALFAPKTVIAAVRSKQELEHALCSRAEVIFLLSGTISELPALLRAAHRMGKKLFLHLDMIEGLAKDAAGVEYAAGLAPDGIISTRGQSDKDCQKLRSVYGTALFHRRRPIGRNGARHAQTDKADLCRAYAGTCMQSRPYILRIRDSGHCRRFSHSARRSARGFRSRCLCRFDLDKGFVVKKLILANINRTGNQRDRSTLAACFSIWSA